MLPFANTTNHQNAALQKAKTILIDNNVLHACEDFRDKNDPSVSFIEECFNPERVSNEIRLYNRDTVIITDTNIIARMEDILRKGHGQDLTPNELSVICMIILGRHSDVKITPGFGLFENLSTAKGSKHWVNSYHAYDYLWTKASINDLSTAVFTKLVPKWEVAITDVPRKYPKIKKIIKRSKAGTRQNAELHSAIIAATIEKKYGADADPNLKFIEFIKAIHDKGAFALGSIKYFGLYFSDNYQNFGTTKKGMLKKFNSSRDKVIEGVLNAAYDCWFVSEFASSINESRNNKETRIFATLDNALKSILTKEFSDRDLWRSGISEILERIRGMPTPDQATAILNKTLLASDRYVERPKLRSGAVRFNKNQETAIKEAWRDLEAFIPTTT